MSRTDVLRSAGGRLAALYTGGFAIGVALLGVVTFLSTRAALVSQFEQRIRSESLALAQEHRVEGLNGVLQAVRERDRTPGDLDYGLIGPDGAPLAGRLARAKAPTGWSTISFAAGNEPPEKVRLLCTDLAGGYRLLVGDDDERIEKVGRDLVVRFCLAFLGVLVLGGAGGYGLSRGIHRRLTAITDTAEAIIDGDLSRRVPVRHAGDDLDRLAGALNRMLDRIQALMESLRQVSSDIAHDLRTPLTRLRQRLEEAAAANAGRADAASFEAALADLDAILSTFAALLRIAQIESGARKAGFRPTDLRRVASTVVEAFAPDAEDQGGRLRLADGPPVAIEGDPELLTQLLANLVENSLRHGGAGVSVIAAVQRSADGADLVVSDTGPGVPEHERQRLFDRFYRLEHSRSTPGAGLGLALVAAVARLHGAEVRVCNLSPGLEVRVAFPQRRRDL